MANSTKVEKKIAIQWIALSGLRTTDPWTTVSVVASVALRIKNYFTLQQHGREIRNKKLILKLPSIKSEYDF